MGRMRPVDKLDIRVWGRVSPAAIGPLLLGHPSGKGSATEGRASLLLDVQHEAAVGLTTRDESGEEHLGQPFRFLAAPDSRARSR